MHSLSSTLHRCSSLPTEPTLTCFRCIASHFRSFRCCRSFLCWRISNGQKYKFKLTNHGTAPNFPFTNGQFFKFELLKHATAHNFPFMFTLPRPSLPYHHSAHRQVGLQLFHSGQICRPWRKIYASHRFKQFENLLMRTDSCGRRR
jgi:hypothetical protein